MPLHRTLDESQIDALEGRLAGTLKRFPPPTDYVQRLRGRIHLPERGELVIRLQDWQRLGRAFAFVLSGTVIILTVARAMYYLFWRRAG